MLIRFLHGLTLFFFDVASRPVTCLLLVGASLLCDIVEQIAVVSNMVPTDWSTWYEAAYGSNTLDALGDIFLALALWYFSCIWSDNVALLRHKGGELLSEERRGCSLK